MHGRRYRHSRYQNVVHQSRLPRIWSTWANTHSLTKPSQNEYVTRAVPKRTCHLGPLTTHLNKPAPPTRNQTKPCLNQLKPSTRPSPPQTIPNQPVHATHPAHNPRPLKGLENNWFSYVFSVFPNHRCKLFVPFYPVNWPRKKCAPIGLRGLIGAHFFGCVFTW